MTNKKINDAVDIQPGRAYEHVQRKLTEQERTALRESLAAHGLRDEITLDQHGDILDGYNREELCGELGIERRYRTLEVADPVHWIRHNQTARRNLNAEEMRGMIIEEKKRDPEASTRTIAEKLGTTAMNVSRTLNKTGVTPVTRTKGKDGKTYMPKPRRVNDEKLEKALNVYDRRKLAGEPLTYEAIREEAGTSATPVRRAIAMRQGMEAVEQHEDIILSASMQEKFEAKVRAFRKQLDMEVETRARELTRKNLDEWEIPRYMKALQTVERLLAFKRGIIKRAEYNQILRCVHPDTGAHISDDKRGEAFRILTSVEAKLVDDDAEQADLRRVSTLPRTVEELMRAKAQGRPAPPRAPSHATVEQREAARAARKERKTP